MAATINVNTFADQNGPTGGVGCSLREAVHAANNDTAFGGCSAGSGADTINLPNGTYTLLQFDGSQFSWDTPDESNNLMNDVDIRTPITIVGSTNPWDVIITRSATAPVMDDQFFEVYGTTATFQGITFTDAAPNHSTASRGGGALYLESSTVTIDNCLFYANTGSNQGGGFFQRRGAVVVQRSSFYNNTLSTGGVGGAIYSIGFSPNTTRVYNSTFEGNVVGGRGGALYGDTGSNIQLYNCTVTNNRCGTYYLPPSQDDWGGGAANIGIWNSVVTGNIWVGGFSNELQIADDCHSCGSGGYNLVGSNSGFTPAGTDTYGTVGSPLAPDLGSITPASPPFTSTPARTPSGAGNVRNAGDPYGCRDDGGALLLTDQHGIKRHQHDACDRGAMEYDEASWADVALAVSATPGTVNAGQNATFTVTMTVVDFEGPTASGNVNLTFNRAATVASATWTDGGPATSCTAGPPVSCALSRTNANPVTITVLASTLDGGTFTGTATHTIPDPLAGDDTDAASVTVVGVADLAASSSSSDTAIQDDFYDRTFTFVNNGPSTATSATATITLPASNVDYDDASWFGPSSSGSCSFGTQIVCNVGDVPSGATVNIFVTVIPRAGASGSFTFTPDAPEVDLTPGNDTASPSITVTTSADLSSSSYHSVAPYQDAPYTRTFQIDNSGPTTTSASTTATIVLPSNSSYVSSSITAPGASGSCSGTTTLVCTIGSLQAGQSATVDVTVIPIAGASDDFTLTANAPETDPDGSNDTNNFTLTPTAEADLSASSSHVSPPVQDAPYTRTFVVYNDGPSTTSSTTATIDLPSGIDTISSSFTAPNASGSCSLVGSTLTCTLGALADNQQATITVTVTPRASASGSFDMLADAPEDDPNTTNDTNTFNINAGAAADLVTASSTNDAAIQDAPYTRTFTVGNNGPTTTSSTTLTIDLPNNVDYLASMIFAPNGSGSCALVGSTLTCTIGSLAAGQEGTVEVAVVPRAGASGSFAVDASAPQADPVPGNNDDGSFVFSSTTSADLSVSSSSSDTPFRDAPYDRTFSVHNAGPTATSSTTLTITLPDNVDYAGSTGSCALAGTTLTCAIGPLTAGQNGSVDVTVIPRAGAGGWFEVVADAPEVDPSANDNEGAFALTPVTAADLDAGSSSTYPVVQDALYVRTFVVTNDGPTSTSSTTATITLPSGVDYVGATGSCTIMGSTLTCQLGALDAGENGSVAVTIIPRAGASGSFTLTASAPENDPTPGNNADVFTLVTTAVSDLSAGLSVSSGAIVGGEVTMTLTVTNAGPSTTSATTGSITLPNGASLVSSSITAPSASGACTTGAFGVVSCALGSLAATQSGTATMVVAISGSGVGDIPFTATSPGRDPQTATGSGSVGWSPDYIADLAVTAGPALTASAGGAVDATFTVTNNGPSPVGAAALSFEGAGFQILTANAAGDCNDTSCDLGPLAAHATTTVTVTLRPLALGNYGITAAVMSGADDSTPENDRATQTIAVDTVASGFEIGKGSGGSAGKNNSDIDDLTVRSRKNAGACSSGEPSWFVALCLLALCSLRRRAPRR